jgi:hypothetical protein
VHLDKFVYDPNKSNGALAIEATRGTFRFVTGSQGSGAYKVKTPYGTLGRARLTHPPQLAPSLARWSVCVRQVRTLQYRQTLIDRWVPIFGRWIGEEIAKCERHDARRIRCVTIWCAEQQGPAMVKTATPATATTLGSVGAVRSFSLSRTAVNYKLDQSPQGDARAISCAQAFCGRCTMPAWCVTLICYFEFALTDRLVCESLP